MSEAAACPSDNSTRPGDRTFSATASSSIWSSRAPSARHLPDHRRPRRRQRRRGRAGAGRRRRRRRARPDRSRRPVDRRRPDPSDRRSFERHRRKPPNRVRRAVLRPQDRVVGATAPPPLRAWRSLRFARRRRSQGRRRRQQQVWRRHLDRDVSFILYVNDAFTGGKLHFPAQDLKIDAEGGPLGRVPVVGRLPPRGRAHRVGATLRAGELGRDRRRPPSQPAADRRDLQAPSPDVNREARRSSNVDVGG